MMSEHQIDFSPGLLARKYIQNEFLNEKWNRFKTWLFDTYSKEDLNNISQEFYETCALHNHIMFFVPWFMITAGLREITNRELIIRMRKHKEKKQKN